MLSKSKNSLKCLFRMGSRSGQEKARAEEGKGYHDGEKEDTLQCRFGQVKNLPARSFFFHKALFARGSWVGLCVWEGGVEYTR